MFLRNPNRHLVVCSEIAIVGWDSQGDLDRNTVRIKLPVRATALLSWTAIASLASIQHDDSPYTFATDSVQPTVAPDRTVFLEIEIAVQGDLSTLNRVSYQTHLLIALDQPAISGTITWSEADVTTIGGPPRFQVAGRVTNPDPGGGFGSFQELISGSEDAGSEVVQGGVHTVSYSLQVPIAQLQTPLLMAAQIIPGTMSAVDKPAGLGVSQIHGQGRPPKCRTQPLPPLGGRSATA